MSNQELYKLYRGQQKHLKFTDFLDNLEKKCEFCSSFCGNSWCVTNENEMSETSETEAREEAEVQVPRVSESLPEVQEGESTDKAEQGVQGQEQVYSEGKA